MYINITDSETGNNKGSCGKLVNYLEKENHAKLTNHQPELWFSNDRLNVVSQEVRVKMDNNIAKLGQNDAKFFLINISPSQKEIAHLKELFGIQGAEDKLKEFATKVMDAYATGFKRNGIESSRDLLWYGKLEHYRYYTNSDKEVKEGLKKNGDRKEGDQMHIQIIVSRKDITNKIKLSPMNNSRGKNMQHSAKLGQFDRIAFKQAGEIFFDSMFDYNRQLKDSIDYALTMKNGSKEQKQLFYALKHTETRLADENKEVYLEFSKNTSGNTGQGLDELFNTTGSFAEGLLGAFLFAGSTGNQQEDLPPSKKKKKKRFPGQSHS